MSAQGTTTNNYLFAGEQLEPALGLYNLRARNYDSSVGRFVSADPFRGEPADPRTLHPYVYAHADPVNQTDPTGLFTLVEASATLGIQDVLKGLDLSRTALQYCGLTGKLEVAQEVLFWGQFAALGPILAESLAGDNHAGVDVTFAARRFINVFKSPDKIIEAKGSVSLKDGDGSLSFDFKREDGFEFGLGVTYSLYELNNERHFDRSKLKFNLNAGGVSVGLGSDTSVGFKKSIEIFKLQKCTVDLLNGKLDVEAKVSAKGFRPQATITLRGVANLLKFKFPLLPE
jgi:RHS repeat-associated protein